MIKIRIEDKPDSNLSRMIITDDNDTGIMSTDDY